MGSLSRGRTQAGYTSPFEASGWTRRVSRRALRWALSEAGQVPPHGMTKASSHAAARAATAQRSTRLDRGYALTLQVTASGTNVYKASALGLGLGGGTALCPFYCTCCYG